MYLRLAMCPAPIPENLSQMLTNPQRTSVAATMPALREHGETIARTFYGEIVAARPELYNLFYPSSQRDGDRAKSLAASVLADAKHIDAPSAWAAWSSAYRTGTAACS